MRLVAFVVDTSASMGQKSVNGMTYLDCCKAAVEHYFKRSMTLRQERHFLVTCAPGLAGIVSGWKDSFGHLMEQLKLLSPDSGGGLGEAIRKAFDLINLHRFHSGVDVYGQGRKPWINAQGTVIVLTDGGVSRMDVSESVFNISQVLTPEFYRCDQRLFGVVSAFPRLLGASEARPENKSVDALEKLSDKTGGSVYYPNTLQNLLQSIESIVERMFYPGVTLSCNCVGNIPKSISPEVSQFIRLPVLKPNAPPPTLWWPLPEDYFATVDMVRSDATSANLAQYSRNAHVSLYYAASDKKLSLLQSVPVDKYELEHSNFTVFFLKTVKEGMCWPLFSRFNQPLKVYKNGQLLQSSSNEGKLVGFIKQSVNRPGVVNCYILPYNFPELFQLLDDLVSKQKGIASDGWKKHFDGYVRNLPYYYIQPLKSCLNHMGLSNVMGSQFDNLFPMVLSQNLKKLTAASKQEADKFEQALEADRQARQEQEQEYSNDRTVGGLVVPPPRSKLLSKLTELRQNFDPDLLEERHSSRRSDLSGSTASSSSHNHRAAAVSEERRFSLPIAVMGDYHSKKLELRPAKEQNVKVKPLFGNPFFPIEKIRNRLKKDDLVLDESEELLDSSKRKRSPTRQNSPEYKSKNRSSPPEKTSRRESPPERTSRRESPPDLKLQRTTKESPPEKSK